MKRTETSQRLASSIKKYMMYLLPTIRLRRINNLWEKDSIVEEYSLHTTLHKPEQTVLSILKPLLLNMKMLDIGVGAGRTTINFAPLVKEYVGIDSSANMIAICKKRFSDNKGWIFKVTNAVDLHDFKDNQFDFVLFSFNGLDYILNHQNRQKALKEIRRVLKPNGYFYFTSHNLNHLWRFCIFESLSRHEIRRMLLMRLYNWKSWKTIRDRNKKITYIVANNGTHNFRAPSYFVSPKSQVEILQNLDFKKIRVYDLEGKLIEPSHLDQDDKNSYLHYFCQ